MVEEAVNMVFYERSREESLMGVANPPPTASLPNKKKISARGNFWPDQIEQFAFVLASR